MPEKTIYGASLRESLPILQGANALTLWISSLFDLAFSARRPGLVSGKPLRKAALYFHTNDKMHQPLSCDNSYAGKGRSNIQPKVSILFSLFRLTCIAPFKYPFE